MLYAYSYIGMCLDDLNWHAGGHIDGFNGVRGGYGVGQWNFVVRMLLEFCLEKEICVPNK